MRQNESYEGKLMLKKVNNQLFQAQERAMHKEAKTQQEQAASDNHSANLETIYNSTSWRITALLRWSSYQVSLMYKHGIKARFKAFIKKVLKILVLFLVAKPKLITLGTQVAKSLGVAHLLKPFVKSCLYAPVATNKNNAALSSRAAQIFADLKIEIEKQKREK